MALKTKKKLETKADDNTTVTLKKGGDPEEVIKEGTPLDHEEKHQAKEEGKIETTNVKRVQRVGMSKGCTINMGDYQSFRVDCWVVDEVQSEESIEEAYDRLSEVIDKQIDLEVEKMND